ncbi:MAG: radical SAM protein, partial [Bacteroidales bacterium]|nr:radical SAM protein [Bacteroidales bacterium]
MKFRIIYPKWKKLKEQTPFFLPPHGPVVMAAALPDDVTPLFTDENVSEIDFEEDVAFVGISMMLSTQVKRGFEIAQRFRKRGVKVIFGGISAMLHAQEAMEHGDSVFLGEVEGRLEEVFSDFRQNRLKPVYNYMTKHPDIELARPARRDLYDRSLYNHKGVQMVDL